MRRFILLLITLFVLWLSWPYIEKKSEEILGPNNPVSQVEAFFSGEEFKAAMNSLYDGVLYLFGKIEGLFDENPKPDPMSEEEEKPTLSEPTAHIFSIHNLEIGDDKKEIKGKFGEPKRVSSNEYGAEWHTYHENYRNFFMVMYDENEKVAGLYTNQDIISSTKGIKLGSTMVDVLQMLGNPVTTIQKGFVVYQLQDNEEYNIFYLDESYITVFYDIHENNTVTSIQIISEEMEQQKKDIYSEGSESLKEGFEYQLFDLTNASRVVHQLHPLSWDDHVRETAREHSLDMAVNDFFNHTNLQGQSPFDRMKEDDLIFTVAGENLAYGQFSSIFAHEGLMNSLGHRENILNTEFDHLGVGVAFNTESHPYYTENFYSN